jgi:hypothetical protein
MGSPKLPKEKAAPLAPPPPAPIAEELKTPELKKRRDTRRRGASGLIIRRPSVNFGSNAGSGLRV